VKASIEGKSVPQEIDLCIPCEWVCLYLSAVARIRNQVDVQCKLFGVCRPTHPTHQRDFLLARDDQVTHASHRMGKGAIGKSLWLNALELMFPLVKLKLSADTIPWLIYIKGL
jgi:hypothetical protein